MKIFAVHFFYPGIHGKRPGIVIGEQRDAVRHFRADAAQRRQLRAQGVAALQEFEAGARLRRVTFEPGEAPNDAEGFESWVFDVNGGEGGFTYVYNGSGEYVLMDGEWYALENGVPLA